MLPTLISPAAIKFPLGAVVATPAALDALTQVEETAIPYLRRHLLGDWGDCCSEDKAANDLALTDGSRIFSVYHLRDKTKIWIITEADRSSTCVLLPSDY